MYETFYLHASRKCQSKTNKENRAPPPLSCRNDKLMLFFQVSGETTLPSPKNGTSQRSDSWRIAGRFANKTTFQEGRFCLLGGYQVESTQEIGNIFGGRRYPEIQPIKIHTNEKTCKPCLVGFWVSRYPYKLETYPNSTSSVAGRIFSFSRGYLAYQN